jgi:hypothetical protein
VYLLHSLTLVLRVKSALYSFWLFKKQPACYIHSYIFWFDSYKHGGAFEPYYSRRYPRERNYGPKMKDAEGPSTGGKITPDILNLQIKSCRNPDLMVGRC